MYNIEEALRHRAECTDGDDSLLEGNWVLDDDAAADDDDNTDDGIALWWLE